jgi:ATP-dependent exoDNAse (exonuclease V) beta subunit
MDKNLGLAIKSINLDEKKHEENPFYSLLSEVAQIKEDEESARLLYVALTRAREGLYIYATKSETKNDNFYDGIPVFSKSFFGWMSEAILANGYEKVELEKITVKPFKGGVKPIDLSQKDDEFVEEIRKRFEKMSEIYENIGKKGLKTSVTKIASEEAEQEIPTLDEERKKISSDSDLPLRKGNAYHKTMELLDFSLGFDEAFALVEKANIPDFNLVGKDKIRTCYEKILPLVKDRKVYKEKSFIYNNGEHLIQGVIDLLLTSGKDAVVIDYKTTSLSSLAQEKTLVEYKIQVGIYAEAVKEIIGYNVKEVMLYSFEKDDFINMM